MGLGWLKNEVWKNWDKGGRTTFVKECGKYVVDLKEEDEKQRRLENGGEDMMDDSEGVKPIRLGAKGDQFKKVIYVLIKKGCKGALRKEKVTSVVTELATAHPQTASLIADTFAALDEETAIRPELREKFVAIVKSVDGVLSYLLLERVNLDNLLELGVVGNKKLFNTRFIRLKTKLYFKQQKYNLFREESEGYAKLISELTPPVTPSKEQYTTQIVQCLIGRFNLDPNRVLDIVLESFECQPLCSFFIPLLKKLMPPPVTVCEIIGFKLQNQESPAESLFIVIALLLQHGIISLEEIYPWLTPEDRIIKKDWDRELKEAKEYARRSMIVTINKDKEEDPDDFTQDDRYLDNQKFCLCEALLSIGSWENAASLMKRLPDYVCVSKKRIAMKMIQFISYIIDPLYRSLRRLTPSLGSNPPLSLTSNEMVPSQVKSYGQLSSKIEIIVALGPYLYHEPILMYKLLRIMKHYLEKNSSKKATGLYYKFITVCDEVILPAMSYLDANCAISEEIWSVLQYYPYHHRFRMYGSWKGESILLMHPSLLRKRVDLVKKIKHFMRRISKENVKPMGRQLGKLAHSMPAVIFDYILSQVQLFDNLIPPVIDALKFHTSLSYDVLTYCLLEALSPSSTNSSGSMSVMLMPNRPRTKHDGSTIAPWLQNLSSFTGAICKKYTLELVPILQYISNQLKSKQGLDLLLLKEIVQKMTGIEAAEEMTSEQLDAMAGGELLRGEAGYFGQVRSSKKSGGRLREAVSMNDLAVTLCILMAQQRNCIVYDDSQSLHTKLVGKLYDQCQDTLVQFGTFLANSCTVDDYAKKIPSLDRLVEEYHVSSDVAFFLWRPIFAHLIANKYDDLRRSEKGHKSMPIVQRQQKYADASEIILGPVINVMRDFLPSKTWEDISPQFYVTFWSLSLYDLFVPTEAYTREITRIKQAAISAGDNKDLPSSKRKKEQERCGALVEKLQDEERRQRDHVDRVMAKLNHEKDFWFASRTAKSAKNEAVTAFLQLCLFPRCIFTAPDALYCAHFVNTIHSLSTPNFSTLICYDRIFCDIIYTVTSCTENEANRYGRFLCALLGTVMKWHGDKSVFDKECASFPGFVTKFRAANTSMTESSDHVDYENFRHVCHKWHYKITKCVIVCLESKDFIQIRNALLVLKRILPYYPKVFNLGNAVERWIERVRADEKDKRQDLFALATSYIGQLKARWGTLITEEEFHQKAAPDKPAVDKAVRVKPLSKEEPKSPVVKERRKTTIRAEGPVTSTASVVNNNPFINIKVANGTGSTSNSMGSVRKEPVAALPRGKEKDPERSSLKKEDRDKPALEPALQGIDKGPTGRRDGMELSTGRRDGIELSTGRRDGMELSTGRRDGIELSTGRRDGIELSTGRRDGIELSTGRRDGIELSTGRRDGIELSTGRRDGIELSIGRRDGLELSTGRRDGIELSSKPQQIRLIADTSPKLEHSRRDGEIIIKLEKGRRDTEITLKPEKARRDTEITLKPEKARRDTEITLKPEKARRDTEMPVKPPKVRRGAAATDGVEAKRRKVENSEPKRKRADKPHKEKTAPGPKSARGTVTSVGNGELPEKDKQPSKKKDKDKSPRNSSRERVYEPSTSVTKSKHGRYK